MKEGLPVPGYVPQTDEKIAIVTEFKHDEERLLRKIDKLLGQQGIVTPKTVADGKAILDPRWAAVARTHFQEGFMALNRAVFQPQRIALPEDEGDQSE